LNKRGEELTTVKIFSPLSRLWYIRLIYEILKQEQASYWPMLLESRDYSSSPKNPALQHFQKCSISPGALFRGAVWSLFGRY